METQAKKVMIVLTIIVIGTMSMCIKDAPEPVEPAYTVPYNPDWIMPTSEPTPTPKPIINIVALKRYDRDGDGVLDEHELQVIETDFHYKRLTGAEITCFVSIIGYTPIINPMPTPNPISTPTKEVEDTWTWDTYYNYDCKLPTNVSMQEYLSNSEWLVDYELDTFDCSQMAAYMERSLENCGYNTVIRCADVEGEDHGHAWILVEFEQGWLAYECTGRYWVYPSEEVARSYDPYGYVRWNPSMYTAGVQYDNIYEVWDSYKWYSNEEAFLKEYGWWI